jgi:LMBR1 domain-containing protein 1
MHGAVAAAKGGLDGGLWGMDSLCFGALQGNRSGIVGCGIWTTDCGGLDLTVVWQIIYVVIAFLVIVGVPFAIFFYETQDEGLSSDQSALKRGAASLGGSCGCAKVLCVALTYTIILAAIAAAVLLISWAYLSYTEIPYKSTVVDVNSIAFFDAALPITTVLQPVGGCNTASSTCACGLGACNLADDTLVFQVTFIVYLAALLSFVGWFLFVLYGGIGLVALPRDLLRAFLDRPRPAKYDTRELNRANLSNDAMDVVSAGMGFGQQLLRQMSESPGFMERRRMRSETAAFTAKFRIMVEELEARNYAFQLSDRSNYSKYYNPIFPWCSLCGSIVLGIVALVWIIHVFVYMAIDPPITPFLNDYFTFFDTFIGFIGTVSLAAFCLYLLFAVVKGAFKFGTRFLICAVHPMQRRRTYMNSFFFNIALVLLCVLPVVQFCTQAFSSYARLTDAGLIFGAQIQNMRFFKYLWQTNAFIYALLGFAGLSMVFFACSSGDSQYVQDLIVQVKKDIGEAHDRTAATVRARGGALGGRTGMRMAVAGRGAASAVREWG